MYVYATKIPEGVSANITFITVPNQNRPVMLAIVKDATEQPIASCPVNWSVNVEPEESK